METMRFNCPQCSQTLEVDPSQAGRMVQCPKCQKLFNAPAAAEVPALPAVGVQPKVPPIAIWSLVLGILGLICCGLFTGIPAAICGHKASARIKASNGALTGAGMALAGMILGYVAMAVSLVMIPLQLAIAIPSFMKSRSDSRKSACINNLRLIDHAKQQLATANPTMTDSYVPAMSELTPYFKGCGMPVCREGGSYSVNCITSNPTCSLSGPPHRHALLNDIY
jgi:predicted Zn finger-like uncharacterized protein